MVDRSKALGGGHKMCKPICDAKRLVSAEEVKDMQEKAALAAEQAAKQLKDMETSGSADELEAAKAEDDAAQQRQIVMADVAQQFEGVDLKEVEAWVEKEEKETFEEIK